MMPITYLSFSERTYALIYELKMIFVKFLSGHKFSINQTCLVELKWKLLRCIQNYKYYLIILPFMEDQVLPFLIRDMILILIIIFSHLISRSWISQTINFQSSCTPRSK